MTPKSRVERMRADADKAEGMRGQHDPGEGLRAHVQGEGGAVRFRNGIPAGIEPQNRPERVEERGGIEVDPDPADIAEGPARTQQQAELLAALEEAKPCATCALPRNEHTVDGLARLAATLGIRPHGFRPAPIPVSKVTITGVDGRPIEGWASSDTGDGSGISHVEPLRGCTNPLCDYTTTGALYCCNGCDRAHAGKYEIHEDGPLGHSALCARRFGSEGRSYGHIQSEQILRVFGVSQAEVDSVAPPADMEEEAQAQRQAVSELMDHNAGVLTEGLLRAIDQARPKHRMVALADVRAAVIALRDERGAIKHRTGTGPAYRQGGELNAFDMVISYLDTSEFTPGEPAIDSIVCPSCAAQSYNPTDIAERYCGVCGYHDGSLRK